MVHPNTQVKPYSRSSNNYTVFSGETFDTASYYDSLYEVDTEHAIDLFYGRHFHSRRSIGETKLQPLRM